MMKPIDRLLNGVTMYRLVLYYLIVLLAVAVAFSALGVLPFSPAALLLSTVFLVAVCWVTNTIFARTYSVPANMESTYISALILALIVNPLQSPADLRFLGWVAVWAMASKYIVAIKGKHLFNPAAFAVALTALTMDQSASWWVGNAPMLPFVVAGGILVIRKMQREALVSGFLATALATTLAFGVLLGSDLAATIGKLFLYSPLLFFAAVILTEPLTTPPTRSWQMVYGFIVGFLFAPQLHLGSFYFTPELAILAGNLFSYLVSPKAIMVLTLKKKAQIAPDIYDFVFTPIRRLSFAPGQYMEWTLGHQHPDSRGNRRYFTLASSPTEDNLMVGVKFYRNASTFKKSMLAMDRDSEIVAAQLAGDFVLPEDRKEKCVFIAGGIGITPFRSMVKYMLDTRQRRTVVLFYQNRTAAEIVYKDVFDQARQKLGIKTIYTLTDLRRVPPDWVGYTGHITAEMIRKEIPDYGDYLFYLSGPNAMVNEFRDVLSQMRIPEAQIKTDFFPGFGS